MKSLDIYLLFLEDGTYMARSSYTKGVLQRALDPLDSKLLAAEKGARMHKLLFE
jgi:hypothetical protein